MHVLFDKCHTLSVNATHHLWIGPDSDEGHMSGGCSVGASLCKHDQQTVIRCRCCPGDALISAPWPSSSGPVDTQALQHFQDLQSVVRSIRNARAEYGVELGRKIPATICVAADSTRCVSGAY